MKYYLDEHKERHYSIPGLWNNTSPVNWPYLEKLGWTMVEEPDPEPVPIVREFSKYDIMVELHKLGVRDKVNKAIDDGGMRGWWNDCQVLREDNDQLKAFVPTVQKILPKGVTVQSILDKCEVTP